jgi:hypothetical protein
MDDHDKKVAALIKHGGSIGGAATGAAIGFLAGGPIGAAIGGAIGAAVQGAASDMADRELSCREAMRVGATMSYAIEFIRERIDAGDHPREDGFFQPDDSKRSPAEEIFEGVLLKAKTDHEERKARFYGQLFTNVAFEPNCSRAEANHLLHLMDSLTFLQLCLVSLFSDPERYPQLPTGGYDGKTLSLDLVSTLAACFELSQNGIIKLWKRGAENGEVVLDPTDIRPSDMVLSPIGKRLFDLAGLHAIGESKALDELVTLLCGGELHGEGLVVRRATLRYG